MYKDGDMPYVKKVFIGTSGWYYPHWKKVFYPPDMKQKEYLAHYARSFGAVEINNSFYQLPEARTLEIWRATVEDSFTFAVKASRYITHMKKLSMPKKALKRFFFGITNLGNTIGPVLFQLPPRWAYNGERLREFLGLLPAEYRYAFEFRDRSWLNDEAFALLRDARAACCIYDFKGYTSPKIVTADFVYVRLHGPYEAYKGSYGKKTLAGWAGAFSAWRKKGLTIHCYFDNDDSGYAVKNALQLQKMMRG